MTTKVLITEFYTSANHGDEAILLGMAKAIKSQNRDAQIKVSCAYPETTERMTGIKSIQPLISVFGRKELWKVPLFLFGLFCTPNAKWFLKRFPVIKDYLESDVIVCSGGGFLNDNYHPAILARLIALYAAKKLGKRVIIYSASVGPFNRKFYRVLARYVFNKLDLLTIRDIPSQEVLKNINVSSPIKLVADSAFSLWEKDDAGKTSEKNISKLISNNNKKKITISVRNWTHFENGSQENYENAISGLVNKLNTLEEEYEVYFVSSCTGTDGYKQDDRKTAKKIYEKIENKKNVYLINEDLKAFELMQLYKKVDLNIGTRMHTNIFSIISETPIIAIRYEDKTIGLMQQFNLTKYLVDIEDVDSEKLFNLVQSAMENNQEIKNQIVKQLPKQNAESLIPAKLLLHTDNEMMKSKVV
ncbi:polysaccharide pyruvyl transferase family protein [Fictibacillus barbaricus]|uniref:Colanic acid/amylovoran biosynthesis protein n=1 Tax=Fictibacillus barbaricus TaxID=182136 RepID=A0ABU1U129_9BACL|nr:polysaccharide pyruvyl transferase family protein [Fictibacillus barbaricus]MDR7073184.1 colanic acid/amylovoran biosynthesis protein [Fictibacillus barbaricus]